MFDAHDIAQLSGASATLRTEILQILMASKQDMHCQDMLDRSKLATDRESLTREVYAMKNAGLITETRRAPGKTQKEVAFYYITAKGIGELIGTEPESEPEASAPAAMQPTAASASPFAHNFQRTPAAIWPVQPAAAKPPKKLQQKTAETKPQEQTMPAATPQQPVKGTTAAVINAITCSPGIKRPKLIAEVMKAVPGATEKKVTDLLYQMASVKKIRVEGEGEERTYHLGTGQAASKKPAKGAPKAKLVTGEAARKAAEKVNGKTRRSPPPAAPAPAPLATGFRFAFGIKEDGGIAIAKNGQTIELAPHEVQTILAHATI